MGSSDDARGVATITDVAKMAGASISTVSRVINKKGGVSRELEARIVNAIEKLSFRPNTVAQALKAKSTKSLGLIIPSIENPVFPPLVKVIEDTAGKYGFSTILCNSDGILEEEARYLELLAEKQVDGIILNAIGDYHERFEAIRKSGTPMIILGRHIEGFQSTCVTIDNRLGAYQATQHLLASGMRKIAFLYGYLEAISAINDRFEGYRQALQDSGTDFDDGLVAHGDRSFVGGAVATEELMRRGMPFDAVFASNDVMALGCIEKLLDSGVRVPEDVSVMGYDDIPIAGIFRPHLSTVRSPVQIFGKEAVKTILRIIYSKKDLYNEVEFKPELVIRQSTRQIAKGSFVPLESEI
jgi:LacI family transcriptional regulator